MSDELLPQFAFDDRLIFFDTNILVYLFDQKDPTRRMKAAGLFRAALVAGRACISAQVVQEFANVASRKFRAVIEPTDVGGFLAEFLTPICRIDTKPELIEKAFKFHEQHGFSFYDALIVQAAVELECSFLLSEDMQHGRVISGVQIVNPFKL